MVIRLTPTQRSIVRLTDEGYMPAVVEWRDRFQHTHDLFGFIDIIAIAPGSTLAVQTTTASNVNARINKIRSSPNFAAVVQAGWRVIVHGWRADGRLREVELFEKGGES